jgi:hypothetical protein
MIYSKTEWFFFKKKKKKKEINDIRTHHLVVFKLQ